MIKRIVTTLAIAAALVLGAGGATYAGVQIHEHLVGAPGSHPTCC